MPPRTRRRRERPRPTAKPPASTRIYPDLLAYFRENPESQAQVARELGVSPALLSMIKWRERQPRLKLALAIVKRCQVPLESLIQKAS